MIVKAKLRINNNKGPLGYSVTMNKDETGTITRLAIIDAIPFYVVLIDKRGIAINIPANIMWDVCQRIIKPTLKKII